MSGWFAMLVIGFFVVWIVLLLLTLVGRRTKQSPLQERVEQIRATARIRMAEAQSRARAAISTAQANARVRPPVIPPTPPTPAPPAVAPTPRPSTQPVALPQAWSVLGTEPSRSAEPAAEDTEHGAGASALDSSLSPSSEPLDPMAQHDPIMDGPQLVPLTAEQQARVVALMDQGAEVMAVRLVCDETRAGILDAHLTVRALVGLPSPY